MPRSCMGSGGILSVPEIAEFILGYVKDLEDSVPLYRHGARKRGWVNGVKRPINVQGGSMMSVSRNEAFGRECFQENNINIYIPPARLLLLRSIIRTPLKNDCGGIAEWKKMN